jgi:hypothetical protein
VPCTVGKGWVGWWGHSRQQKTMVSSVTRCFTLTIPSPSLHLSSERFGVPQKQTLRGRSEGVWCTGEVVIYTGRGAGAVRPGRGRTQWSLRHTGQMELGLTGKSERQCGTWCYPCQVVWSSGFKPPLPSLPGSLCSAPSPC